MPTANALLAIALTTISIAMIMEIKFGPTELYQATLLTYCGVVITIAAFLIV